MFTFVCWYESKNGNCWIKYVFHFCFAIVESSDQMFDSLFSGDSQDDDDAPAPTKSKLQDEPKKKGKC